MIDTSLNSSNFYFLLAVFQGIVLSGAIIFQQPFRKPNFFFGILIFLFSLSLLHLVLEESIHAFNTRFPIPMDFSLAYGPLAYFHILSIKDPSRTFGWRDLIHFLPSVLLDILFFSISFTYLGSNMDWAYQNITLIQSVALIVSFLGLIQFGLYTYLIYVESVNTKQVLREFVKVKKWLSYLITSWCILIGFLMIAIPVALLFIDKVDENSSLLYKPFGTIVGLCIYILGYLYLIRYSKVIRNYVNKVSKINYTTTELDNMKKRLLSVLAQDKPYMDPKMTISKLAGNLGWPINSLSNVINEGLHTNFNDLINQYRVEAFKEKVVAPDSYKYSIAGLGREVGFNSKASFYRAFKKETGMTPSDYLSSERKESQITS